MATSPDANPDDTPLPPQPVIPAYAGLLENLAKQPRPDLLLTMRVGDCQRQCALTHYLVGSTGMGAIPPKVPPQPAEEFFSLDWAEALGRHA